MFWKLIPLWLHMRRARRAGTKAEQIRALKRLAERERWLPGARGRAVAHYEEAVALCRTLDEPLLLAHTVRHLGDVHHDQGRAAVAERCYDEALTIYYQRPDAKPLDFANAVRRVAVLKEEAGDHAEAATHWREAHDLYVKAAEPMGIAESAAWLALLAKRRGDAARAREWLAPAVTAAEATRDPDSLIWVNKVKAEVDGS